MRSAHPAGRVGAAASCADGQTFGDAEPSWESRRPLWPVRSRTLPPVLLRLPRLLPPSPLSPQVEKSFQKQATVFQGYKVLAKAKGKAPRWYRKVGLGFATPQTAIKGVYVDKKCPFTGDVSIRGRILKGIVKSTKMTRTIVLRRDYLRYVSKYRRYEKRHKTVPAHCSPAFLVKDGDDVTVGQCRPLSKTVRFNVLKVESATEAGAARAKKVFRMF